MCQVFTSWSGGKDCCLACYKATASGLPVRYLLNMVTEDGQRSRSHGLAGKWLQMQAQAIGIPLIQQPTGDNDYESQFKSAVRALKEEEISAGVFGDIDFEDTGSGLPEYVPKWELCPICLCGEKNRIE